jgi:hypothetical protein
MFGFDDFALLFAEAAPELLATEGTTAAELAAQEAAREAALAAAQQAAAQEAAQSGILQASQMNPELLNSINGPGVKTAGLGDDFLGFLERNNIGVKGVELNPAGAEYPGAPYGYEPGNAFFDKGPVRLEPVESPYTPEDFGYQGINKYTGRPIVEGTSLNPFPGGTENIMSKTMAHAPLDANALDYSSQIGYEQANSPALQDYQRTQLENELAARSAAAPPSNVPQFENPASTTQNVFRGNPAEAGYQPPQVTRGGYFNNGITGEYTDTLSPFERGMDTAGRYFDKAADYVEKNPYKSAALAYYGAYKTGMLDQPKQEPIADNYKNPYTMTGFRRSSPAPSAYRYTPRYAEGGITSYARGGRSKAESMTDFYDAMNSQHNAPPALGDVGIYYDMDPKTRYLDPLEAAQYRMSVINANANVQAPTMHKPNPMGTLNFKPVAAAKGGIMGYADGGLYNTYQNDEEYKKLGKSGLTKAEILSAALAAAYGGNKNTSHINIDNGYYPASSAPVTTNMPITSTAIGGGGGGGGGGVDESGNSTREPSAWSQMTPAERAAYYAEHPIEGGLALGAQDALGWTTLGGLAKVVGKDAWYDSRLEKMGVNPTISVDTQNQLAGNSMQNALNSQAASQAYQSAITAANTDNQGLAANPMSTDPSQRGGNGGISSVGPVGRGEGGQDSAGEHGASLAHGGIAGYSLGGYAAGGNPRLLRGPGDGMSDNIPATINNRQPARLADGEFVVPADVVSHLGNGSTEAGAKQLHDMMTRIRKGRTGNPRQGKQINPQKYLPA